MLRRILVVGFLVAFVVLQTEAQDYQVIECANPAPPPPTSGVCEVISGDSNLLVKATLLTEGTVFEKAHLLIDPAGMIVCAGCDCSGQPGYVTATVIACAAGVVSPGLINLHDHTNYADSPPVDHGSERYDHRHEWRLGLNGHTEVTVPSSTNSTAGRSWAELRHLLAGTTSIVGPADAPLFLRNLNDTVHQDGLGQSPPLYATTFPFDDASGEMLDGSCDYPGFDGPYPGETFVPHVAEGIGPEARNEFLCLSDDTLPDGHDVIDDAGLVHAIGLTPFDISKLADINGSIVWAPRSNISLYGMTASITVYANLGVNIALGTDWLASGSMNLSRELQCAKTLSSVYLSSIFSDHDLVGMATWNAAEAAGLTGVIGELQAGLFGDIVIFDGSVNSNYSAVVDAGPADVVLVLKGGMPMFGDTLVMEDLGAGDGLCEPMSSCLDGKRVCVTREGAAAGLTLASLSATFVNYPLFTCSNPPPDEPTCTPFRNESDGIYFDGIPTAGDADGDGVADQIDNCPFVFNPPRPVDGFVQGDADIDGIGDECDLCPFDSGGEVCLALFADGFESGDTSGWPIAVP